jgi:hypothetical protein
MGRGSAQVLKNIGNPANVELPTRWVSVTEMY